MDEIRIVLSTPELDACIKHLECLAISGEPRSPFEDHLIDCVTVLARIVRSHVQYVPGKAGQK